MPDQPVFFQGLRIRGFYESRHISERSISMRKDSGTAAIPAAHLAGAKARIAQNARRKRMPIRLTGFARLS